MKKAGALIQWFTTFGVLLSSLSIQAEPPVLSWLIPVTGGAWKAGNGVALDSNGNACVLGHFQGKTSFGGNILNSGWGGTDVFIAKYSPEGRMIWVRQIGQTFADHTAGAVTVGPHDTLFVTGSFQRKAKLGGTTLRTNYRDLFLAKYDAGGSLVWARSSGSSEKVDGHGLSVAADSSGGAFLGARFSGQESFGGVKLPKHNSSFLLTRYNPDGSTAWAWTSTGGRTTLDLSTFGGLSSDGSRYLFSAAAREGNLKFGTQQLHESLYSEGVLLKFDFSGTPVSAIELGPGVGARALQADSKGDLFLAVQGTAGSSVGNQVLTNGSGVVKLSSSGSAEWATETRGLGVLAVALDSQGCSYLTGINTGPSSIGSLPIEGGAKPSAFVAKLNANGKPVWATAAVGSGTSEGAGVAVDGSGRCVVTGSFFGSMTLLGQSLQSSAPAIKNANVTDAFVLSLKQ